MRVYTECPPQLHGQRRIVIEQDRPKTPDSPPKFQLDLSVRQATKLMAELARELGYHVEAKQ